MKYLCLIGIIISAVFLSACTPPEPTIFGVKESVWKTLTPSERKQVIQGYNQTQKINAKNAPIESAIGAASNAVQAKQNDDEWNHQQKNLNNGFPANPPMPTPPPMPNMNPPKGF